VRLGGGGRLEPKNLGFNPEETAFRGPCSETSGGPNYFSRLILSHNGSKELSHQSSQVRLKPYLSRSLDNLHTKAHAVYGTVSRTLGTESVSALRRPIYVGRSKAQEKL
jgi:hypothetical protein